MINKVDLNKILANEFDTKTLTHEEWKRVQNWVELLRMRVVAHTLEADILEKDANATNPSRPGPVQ